MSEVNFAKEPRIISLGGVAISPPKLQGVTKKRIGGMEVPEFKNGLQECVVVMPSQFDVRGLRWHFEPGMTVYVQTASLMAFPWGKDTFEVMGVPFLVVPIEYVVALKP